MLNEELFKEFGEESKTFFVRFSQMFHSDVLSKCYAMRGSMIHSGNLHAPSYISVCANTDTASKVFFGCNGLCARMSNPSDENDVSSICTEGNIDEAEKDGVKIWV